MQAGQRPTVHPLGQHRLHSLHLSFHCLYCFAHCTGQNESLPATAVILSWPGHRSRIGRIAHLLSQPNCFPASFLVSVFTKVPLAEVVPVVRRVILALARPLRVPLFFRIILVVTLVIFSPLVASCLSGCFSKPLQVVFLYWLTNPVSASGVFFS